jgi:hypothetical protein
MAITAGVLLSRKFRGRQKIGPSLANGVKAVGDKVTVLDSRDYRGPFSDVLLFYGFDGSRNTAIYKAYCDYKREGKRCVYVDLGYFRQRAALGRYGDYHRFTVSGPDIGYRRHPTAYFQRVKHPADRISQFQIRLDRCKPGKHILLCGMSQKCAEFEGFKFEQWERDAVSKIKQVTDRPIHYRPKPNKYNQYSPIPGTVFAPPVQGIGQALRGAWATVSHHSNAGIDGICQGIPAFCAEGVCSPVGNLELSRMEDPHLPTDDERRQWLADVAYTQWNRAEMDSGAYWKHLKDEGLV